MLEDVTIATHQDIPGNELEILEDETMTQENHQKIFDEKDAYTANDLAVESTYYSHCCQSISTWGQTIGGAASLYLKQCHLFSVPMY